MEQTNNILMDKEELEVNTKVKITYNGKLFKDNSEKGYIRYGFGDNWNNLQYGEMTKTENGFQYEVDLISSEPLTFCVANENGDIDDNEGQNYIFAIENNAPKSLMVIKRSSHAMRRLNRTYIWSKKIKIALYKIITYLPRLVSRKL